jgi:hypothetical protein
MQPREDEARVGRMELSAKSDKNRKNTNHQKKVLGEAEPEESQMQQKRIYNTRREKKRSDSLQYLDWSKNEEMVFLLL